MKAITWTPAILREYRQSLPRARNSKGRGNWGECLTQNELAAILGVSGRTVTRWEAGASAIPQPVQQLLNRMARHGRKQFDPLHGQPDPVQPLAARPPRFA